MINTHGWKNQSKVKAVDFIKEFNPNIINSIIYTDISRDGSLQGVSLDQTISFSKSIPHPVIASGGVSSIKDIIDLINKFSDTRFNYKVNWIFTNDDGFNLIFEDDSKIIGTIQGHISVQLNGDKIPVFEAISDHKDCA